MCKTVTEWIVNEKGYKILHSLIIKNTCTNLAAWTSLNIFHWPGDFRTMTSERTGGFQHKALGSGGTLKKKAWTLWGDGRSTQTHSMLIMISFLLLTCFRHWGNSYVWKQGCLKSISTTTADSLGAPMGPSQPQTGLWLHSGQPGGYSVYSSLIGHGGNRTDCLVIRSHRVHDVWKSESSHPKLKKKRKENKIWQHKRKSDEVEKQLCQLRIKKKSLRLRLTLVFFWCVFFPCRQICFDLLNFPSILRQHVSNWGIIPRIPLCRSPPPVDIMTRWVCVFLNFNICQKKICLLQMINYGKWQCSIYQREESGKRETMKEI